MCTGGECELVILIVVLPEIQQDRSGFEYGKIVAGAVDKGRDTPVRVQFGVPGLLLNALA